MRLRLILSLLALASAIPAQNLLKWDAWKQVNPQYMPWYGLYPEGPSWSPYSYPHDPLAQTGFKQTITVPCAGLYQLNTLGTVSATGTMPLDFEFQPVNGAPARAHRGADYDFALAFTVWLPAGQCVVTMLSGTDYACPSLCSRVYLDGLELAPAIEPTIDLEVWDLGRPRTPPSIDILTKANILAMSLGKLQAGIPIPGLAHKLMLDPTKLVIVGTSVFGQVRVWMPNVPPIDPPTLYLQAATFKSFGSVVKI